MYFSSVRGNFFKAHVQNHYEKVRCDHYMKEVSKRHVHSLANINKSIKDTRDTLRDIQTNSGYCRDDTGPKSYIWNGKSETNLCRSDAQARPKTSVFQREHLVSGETTVDGVRGSSLTEEKNERNILEQSEISMDGKKGPSSGRAGAEMNGDRSGRLLRDDELVKKPESRNVSGGGTRGIGRQGTDKNCETQGKRHGKSMSSDSREHRGSLTSMEHRGSLTSREHRGSLTSREHRGSLTSREHRGSLTSMEHRGSLTSREHRGSLTSREHRGSLTSREHRGSLTSRADEPPKSIGPPKLGKSTGRRSQTAPEKAARSKPQPKSARTQEDDELMENIGSRYLFFGDVRKLKIHLSISRTEKKRILQELISSCTVPCDRSVLERERQRRLQDKIHNFFQLLFEQDDEEKKDDGSDIFDDE